MANNRIYLRCKGCGEELFLGKRFDAGYFYQRYPIVNGVAQGRHLEEELNNFYDKHDLCGKGFDCFEIAYEYEPEYEDWDEEPDE